MGLFRGLRIFCGKLELCKLGVMYDARVRGGGGGRSCELSST